MISFIEALEAALLADDQPVVTDYDVFLAADALLSAGVWNDIPIKHAPKFWDTSRTSSVIGKLVSRQALAADQDFKSGVWRLVQSTRSGSAEEITCIADPFCYVSHLSAMQRYGLTDRSPEALHLSRPSRPVWNGLKAEKIAAEVAPHDQNGAGNLLLHFGINATVRRRPVIVHETKYPATPVDVRGERTRMASVAQTYVDMLAEPHLCGGVQHALEIWDQGAADWLDAIIEAVNAAGAKIVKVRAGYILSERLGLNDPRIDAWRAFAQRGGSRKLDPDAPYQPVFSETWMISLNV